MGTQEESSTTPVFSRSRDDADGDAVQSLLDGRLVLVTGKGGTGKTTFAAALGVLGAQLGRRTAVVEVDAQNPSLAAIFGQEPTFEPVAVRDRLEIGNVRWEASLASYLKRMVPIGRVVDLILDNPVVGRFLDFTPGSREVVILSRIGQLVEEYDLVVVDMPASGHALSLLDVLRSVRSLFQSGPVLRRCEELAAMLAEPTSRLAFVALPEEMVVNETLETWERLRASEVVGGDPVVFLNRSTLPSLVDEERELISRLSALPLSGLAEEMVRAGRWEDRLERATAVAHDRLAEVFPTAPVLVPPTGAGGVPREVTGSVAVHLGRLVGVSRRELRWT